MNGISVLIKGLRNFPCPLPPHGNTRRSWQPTTQKRALTRTQPCWHLDLKLPASKIMNNKFLLFTSHPVYGTLFVIEAKQTKIKRSLERCTKTGVYAGYYLLFPSPQLPAISTSTPSLSCSVPWQSDFCGLNYPCSLASYLSMRLGKQEVPAGNIRVGEEKVRVLLP